MSVLTITTAADHIHKYFFIVFPEKIRLDVSSESSARQRIHMKNQALFSSKDKSEKLKCRLLHFLFGALRVKFRSARLDHPCHLDESISSFRGSGGCFISTAFSIKIFCKQTV